jgi:hypothetical protein
MILAVCLTVLLLLAFRGAVVMVLWNWLMPTILHLPEISFFEAVGLFLLVSFLMGSVVDKNAIPSKKSEKK